MAKANPAQFIREVRQETARVTWPTRKEVMVTTMMVLVMVIIIAMFFFAVDWAIGHLIKFIFGFGG